MKRDPFAVIAFMLMICLLSYVVVHLVLLLELPSPQKPTQPISTFQQISL